MNALVVKILAVGLTLSQLFTKPSEQFITKFDPQADKAKIEEILRAGCSHWMKEFGAEQIKFELLFEVMIKNIEANKKKAAAEPQKAADEGSQKVSAKSLADQLDIPAVYAAYKQFCKGEEVENSPLKMEEVVEFYNKAFVDLPDPNKLKNLKLPESSLVLDGDDERFTEIYADNNRRTWVPIEQIPDFLQKAFVAAEDKRFYQHNGIDIRGIIRAFATGMSSKGRPQGGSTITQQVVKNLLVGDDLTFERKMREMYLATRVEKILTKKQILELYMNYVFLGRSSWGVEMASKSYFGKRVGSLTINEAAILAGLTKGPNYFHPQQHPDRFQDRREYVLSRMKEDGYLTEAGFNQALAEKLDFIKFESPRSRAAYYFLDEMQRDARDKVGIKTLTSGSYTVHSTIHRGLQKAAEMALQDGLANYEVEAGRIPDFEIEGSLREEIERFGVSWKELLPKRYGKFWDIHWTLATVIDNGQSLVKNADGSRTRSGVVKVGLPDGREAIVNNASPRLAQALRIFDLVRVRVNEGKNLTASLRVTPEVEGAIVVLEAKTGRVLAMSGGFSYAISQLNRATRSIRQPGSTLKPFIYLAGLQKGLQPNTLIPDAPFSLPPIAKGGHWWSPRNYDGNSRGMVTMRRAVEMSLNLPTARLMSQLGQTPQEGLDYVRGVTKELGIYSEPIRFYPIVLGAQPVRLIDMVVAYATVANMGLKPVPHLFDSIEQNGRVVYERPSYNLQPLPGVDRVSFFQLRRILEGTLVRGTAVRIKDLEGVVAGKTGTSNGFNDTWFVGFTNDIVVGVWVGYDNSGKRSSLGAGFTGGRVALPIAERVFRESFKIYKDKEPLAEPPPDVRAQIGIYGIDVQSGNMNGGTFPEVFRLENGGPRNTVMALLNRNEMHMAYAPGTYRDVNGENSMIQQETQEGMPQMQAGYPPGYMQPGYPPAGYPQGYPQPGRGYNPRDAYQPGADDQYEMWRRNNRRVDPNYILNPYVTY